MDPTPLKGLRWSTLGPKDSFRPTQRGLCQISKRLAQNSGKSQFCQKDLLENQVSQQISDFVGPPTPLNQKKSDITKPPTPLNQKKSAFAKLPLPPLMADVICEQPLKQTSTRQDFS